MFLAVGELGIDAAGHVEHAPGGHFLRVRVAGEIAADMAGVAVDTQTLSGFAHGRADLVRLEDLEIRGSVPSLGKRSGGGNKQRRQTEC